MKGSIDFARELLGNPNARGAACRIVLSRTPIGSAAGPVWHIEGYFKGDVAHPDIVDGQTLIVGSLILLPDEEYTERLGNQSLNTLDEQNWNRKL